MLSYSDARYAKDTVIGQGHKLTGWPKNIPFRDFNSIRGGNAVLRRLIRLCKKGKLRFERATAEDIDTARRDPSAIRPGVTNKDSARSSDSEQPSSESPQLSAVTLGDPPRRQRTDTKKPRGRDLTGQYVRDHPLPKEGIKSQPYIIDSDVEDDLGQPAANSERGQFWLVEEPITGLRPTATGSMFGFFALSSHGRPSSTIRLWESGGMTMAPDAAAASRSE